MITLAGQSFAEEAIIQSVHTALDLEQAKHIVQLTGARLEKDGNQWCYIWGTMPEVYIAGFGDTPVEALNAFVYNFRNQKSGIK